MGFGSLVVTTARLGHPAEAADSRRGPDSSEIEPVSFLSPGLGQNGKVSVVLVENFSSGRGRSGPLAG